MALPPDLGMRHREDPTDWWRHVIRDHEAAGIYLNLPDFGKESVCGHKTGGIRPDKTILIRIGYLGPAVSTRTSVMG